MSCASRWPSVTRKPDSAGVASHRWMAVTTASGPMSPRGTSVTRNPCRAFVSAASNARSGTTRWIGATRSPPGPIGVTRARMASLPSRGGSARELARAAAKRWWPSAMTAPVVRRASVSRRQLRRIGHPPQPVPHAVGVLQLQGRDPLPRERGELGDRRFWVVGKDDRLEVRAGRGQQGAAVLDRAGIGVLVREHRGGPGRREGDRPEPAEGRRSAARGLAARRATRPVPRPDRGPRPRASARALRQPAVPGPWRSRPAAQRGRMRRTMLCGSASASRSRPAGVTRS